jgi:hypothetical protein
MGPHPAPAAPLTFLEPSAPVGFASAALASKPAALFSWDDFKKALAVTEFFPTVHLEADLTELRACSDADLAKVSSLVLKFGPEDELAENQTELEREALAVMRRLATMPHLNMLEFDPDFEEDHDGTFVNALLGAAVMQDLELRALRHLGLRRTGIRSGGVGNIVAFVEKHKLLEKVDLYENPKLDDGAGEILNALSSKLEKKLKGLECLNLWVTGLTAEGINALAPTLESATSITEINIRANDIGLKGLIKFVEALSPSARQTVSVLDLSDIRLAASDFKSPLGGFSALQSLKINGNYLGCEEMAILVESFSPGSVKNMTHLNASNNALKEKDSERLAAALSRLSLESLDLSVNYSFGLGIANVLRRLSVERMEELFLGNTGLRELEEKDFGAPLRFSRLNVLDFSGNEKLGNRGVGAWLGWIQTPPEVPLSLDLASTGLNKEGIGSLARYFEERNIAHLDVSTNPKLGAVGLEKLLAAMSGPARGRLLSLVLAGSPQVNLGDDDEKEAAALARILRALPNLRRLNIAGNWFQPHQMARIIQVVNPKLHALSIAIHVRSADEARQAYAMLYPQLFKLRMPLEFTGEIVEPKDGPCGADVQYIERWGFFRKLAELGASSTIFVDGLAASLGHLRF